MSMIFISHSSRNNTQAVAMRDWLKKEGWVEVFLDLDPDSGLATGQKWRDELKKAGAHCAAVVLLISPDWLASKECWLEYMFSTYLGKEIFPVLIVPCAMENLSEEAKKNYQALTATYQIAEMSTSENTDEGYQRLRIGLLRAGLHPDAFSWPPKDEPDRPLYRGLRVLEEKDAAIFFGRDVQITQALDALRQMRGGGQERMLVIVGASGSGKSSFLRAGLLARLQRDTVRFVVLPTLRPGRAALTGPTGLERSLGLGGLPLDGTTISERLAQFRQPVAPRSHEQASRPDESEAAEPPTMVLPIDQAEELFLAGDEEAKKAVILLAKVMEADQNLLLLLTIRSDSLSFLQSNPILSAFQRRLFDLPPLSAAAFKEIIKGPAGISKSGIEIQPELVEQLIKDFEGSDALPLLAFTLERLVADHGKDGRLELSEYTEKMKGMGGVIRKAVDLAFEKARETPGLPETRQDLETLAQRTFLPWLVRIDDASDVPKCSVALRRELPQEALPLINCLVDQRLLVTDEKASEPTVEVAHEAVFRHWSDLEIWIEKRRDELILSERVKGAAHEWQNAQGLAKADALVHRGERLVKAGKLLEWDDLRRKIGETSAAYLEACTKAEHQAEVEKAARQRRLRRLRQWVAGMVAVAALATLLGAVLVVRVQRNLGRSQSLMLARTAERFAKEGDYLRALRLSILASRRNWLMPATPEAMAALSSNAQALNLKMEIRGHDGGVKGAVFTRDEARILTWSVDNTARLWDAATGEQIGEPLKHDYSVTGAVFTRDEARILTWSVDNTARLWDAATGQQIGEPLKHDGAVWGAVFTRDEARILTWSSDSTARLWDAATGQQIGEPLKHDGSVAGAVFTYDEARILTWSVDNTARLWDAATGQQIGEPLKHDGAVLGAVFTRDEVRILTWSGDGTARLWDAATGQQIGEPLEHDGAVKDFNGVTGAVFTRDETRILTWSDDRTARLWNAATGQQIGEPLKHDGSVKGAVFTRDEARILTWSYDRTARLWNAATGQQIGEPLKHDSSVDGAVFAHDEARILTWSYDRTARLWDAATGQQIGEPLKHDGAVLGAVFTRDEARILWDAATGQQIGEPLKHDGAVKDFNGVWGAVFTRDKARILTWSDDRTARLWNAATGQQIGEPLKHDSAVLGAVYNGDKTRILTWSNDRTARLWDAATGQQIGEPLKHDGSVTGAVFARDKARILTWSDDRTARLWDAATGQQIGEPLKHDYSVTGAVFTRDEARILTLSNDRTARLWDAATGQQIGEPLKHDGSVTGAVFTRDKARLLTWSWGGTARLWDAATGQQIGEPLKDDSGVWGAVFARDEARILTWNWDETARLWDVATGQQIGEPLKHDSKVTGAVFARDEARILTWIWDGTSRLWDVHWAMRDPAGPGFIDDLCREKFVGASVKDPKMGLPVGVRHIDNTDTTAAPILRGREGEDVCAPPPTTFQTLRSLLR